VDEFARRTGLGQAVVCRLAEADAFATLGGPRRQALWDALAQPTRRQPLPLWDSQDEGEPSAALPAATMQEEVRADYETLGLTLRPHPLSFYRAEFERLDVTPAAQLHELPDRRQVKLAGLIILRQRPGTGKGITFVTLEDETGIANLVVNKPVWERFHQVARHSNAWFVRGRLEQRHGVIHVIVQHLQDLHDELAQLVQSRDFR
jgi:error-prone DNA polymerase